MYVTCQLVPRRHEKAVEGLGSLSLRDEMVTVQGSFSVWPLGEKIRWAV
jgi:hypothetical protein